MQELDLQQLQERWSRLVQQFPGQKRDLLERAGQQILQRLRSAIGGTGKVASWQDMSMGSKGGYVAVRPRKDTYQMTGSGTRYAVGYITNAIENGHRNRRPQPSGKADYRYRARIHHAATPGRHFYYSVRQQLGQVGDRELRQLAQEILEELGGQE